EVNLPLAETPDPCTKPSTSKLPGRSRPYRSQNSPSARTSSRVSPWSLPTSKPPDQAPSSRGGPPGSIGPGLTPVPPFPPAPSPPQAASTSARPATRPSHLDLRVALIFGWSLSASRHDRASCGREASAPGCRPSGRRPPVVAEKPLVHQQRRVGIVGGVEQLGRAKPGQSPVGSGRRLRLPQPLAEDDGHGRLQSHLVPVAGIPQASADIDGGAELDAGLRAQRRPVGAQAEAHLHDVVGLEHRAQELGA